MKKTAEEILATSLEKIIKRSKDESNQHFIVSAILTSEPSPLINCIYQSMEEYRSQASSELPSDDEIETYEHDVTNKYGESMSNHQTDDGFAAWEIGMKQMRSIASPILASHVARIKELEEALSQAIENIKVWHNADDVWDIYFNNAPEMKKINKALTPKP